MGGDKGSISRSCVRRAHESANFCVCDVCFKCRNRSLTNGSAEGYASVFFSSLESQRRVNLSESSLLVFDRLSLHRCVQSQVVVVTFELSLCYKL